MGKGCIISVMFVSFLVMLGVGIVRYYMLPKFEESGNLGMTELMCEVLAHYYTENGKWPQGNNSEIANEIGGLNRYEKNYVYLNREKVRITDGQFRDAYDRPLKITVLFDGDIQVISSGRDGSFGTSDDAMSRIKPPAYVPPEEPEVKKVPVDKTTPEASSAKIGASPPTVEQ